MKSNKLIPTEIIERRILLIRRQKVLLSLDLAKLYQVEHKVLMQAVQRNLERFPTDFLFQVSPLEFKILKSQFVTSSWGGLRKRPYAFTEQGVAMLSGILHSKRAIQVNIEIMRTFVKLRFLFASHRKLAQKLGELEKKYNRQFKIVFDAIRQIIAPPEKTKRQVGFRVEEPRFQYRIRGTGKR